MTKSQPPSRIGAEDYEIIESAMLETERGRRFLSEFLKRNRSQETTVLLDAINRLRDFIVAQVPRAPLELGKFHMDLMEMSKAISRTREEIAAIKPDQERRPPAARQGRARCHRTGHRARHQRYSRGSGGNPRNIMVVT